MSKPMSVIVSNSGVAQSIVVRRSGFASWLEIDGVMIGLHPDAGLTVDVDPNDTPYIYLRLYANRIQADNCETVAPYDTGTADHGQAEGEAARQTSGVSIRLSESKEVPDP